VSYAGGGGGSARSIDGDSTFGIATDGGANGALGSGVIPTAAPVNRGGGGGASDYPNGTVANGGNGGSGIVVLRYPLDYTITIGAGLTGTTQLNGRERIAIITAGAGNVSFA
jgi:hypothetical protein